jgi:hypothetical protein
MRAPPLPLPLPPPLPSLTHAAGRYYGTVFSTILFIIIMGFTAGHMVYTCYHQIRKPNHRLDELEKLTRAKLAASAVVPGAADGGGDASEGGVLHGGAARRGSASGQVVAGAAGAGGGGGAGEGEEDGGVTRRAGAGARATASSGPSGVPLLDSVRNMLGVGGPKDAHLKH